MKVTLKDNVLTIVTDVDASVIAKKSVQLQDEKGNATYCFTKMHTEDADAELSKYGITCNTIVDGKAAMHLVVPQEKTLEAVKEELADVLIALNAASTQLNKEATEKKNMVDAFFVSETASAN